MNGIKLAQNRSLQWEIDAACNAIKMLANNFNFNELPPPLYTYTEQPFFSEYDRTPEVKAFCDWQHKLCELG